MNNLGSLATHKTLSEDWSDWADAQADLSLRAGRTGHFVGAAALLNLRRITAIFQVSKILGLKAEKNWTSLCH